MARIAVGLGGRVAEELVFGAKNVTTGAENDLQVVTDLARRMVTRWGMSERLGVVFADFKAGENDFSLNMRRFEPDAMPVTRATLAFDVDGRPVYNEQRAVARYDTFAMAAPAASPLNGSSLNALIDAEVRAILEEGRAKARAILTEHRHQLDRLAEVLLDCEQIDRAQFEALLREDEGEM